MIIRATGISKSFGGAPVLRNVDFSLQASEIHALLGENGAGKSTLLKILGGVYQPDAGEIELDGARTKIASPLAAQQMGISLIHQEPLTFPDLDVAENIYIGHETGWIRNRRAMYDGAAEILRSLGVKLSPKARVRGLSIADQQMVELASALSHRARVLLMDEPTASLTPREVDELFRIVRQLKDSGTSIVFISHRLEEVFALCDRITVLRDGELIGTRVARETSIDEVIRRMVGRDLGKLYEKQPAEIGATKIEVKGLSLDGQFDDISLSVRRGEIVGLAGLVGAGRTEVAQALFGIAKSQSGKVMVDGETIDVRTPRDAIARGISYVPEDRQHDGLLLPFSVASNTSLATLGKVSTAGFLRRSLERIRADNWRRALNIRLRSVDQPVRELSGGNQQKVVLGKWLQTDPQILILDEPTRGIDIGAKAEVHRLMNDIARQGKSILMISSDLPEVLAMSDRIIVMREGRIAAEFSRAEATQEKIMSAATRQTAREKGVRPLFSRRSARTRGLLFRELGIAAFIVLIAIVATVLQPRFLSAPNLQSILLYLPLLIVVAMGQMMAIVSRNIDLSVGSILGFAAIVMGNIFVQHADFPIALAAIVTVCIGAGMGLINGLLIAWLRVPAIITTLGTLSAYRGLIFLYSHGRQVDPNYIPDGLIRLSHKDRPWVVLLALAVALLTWMFLRYTRSGRAIFAIGSNPSAAALRGVPVKRTVAMIFTLCGALAGFAGWLYASRFGMVNPSTAGYGFELVVISATIIGGTSVFGGQGSVLGVLLGCLLLGVVNTALAVLGVPEFWQLAVYGGAILLAASLDFLLQKRNGGSAAC